MFPDISVEVNERGQPAATTGSGFDVCNTTYDFTVVANTLTSTDEISATVNNVQLSSISK